MESVLYAVGREEQTPRIEVRREKREEVERKIVRSVSESNAGAVSISEITMTTTKTMWDLTVEAEG